MTATAPLPETATAMATGPAPGRWRAVAMPYAATRVTGQAVEFVGWILLARHLGASSFGELSIAFLACRYAGIVADWGATTRGPRDVARPDGAAGVHAYIRQRTAASLVIGALAASVFVAIGRAHLVPVIGVVLALGLNRDWVSLGRERGWRAASPTLVQGGLVLVGAVLLTGSASAAWVVGAAYLAGALVSIGLNRVPRPVAGAGQGDSRILSVDGWMLAAVLSNQVLSTLDTLLLGWLVSSRIAGIYSAVYRLPNAWIALLGALFAGLIPVATRARTAGPDAFAALCRRTLRGSCGVALIVLASAPVAALLVPILFGPGYRQGMWTCFLLMVATAVITATAPLHPLVVASGADRTYARIVMTGAATNVVANLVLIPRQGMVGAAAATLIAQSLIALLLWRALAGATARR